MSRASYTRYVRVAIDEHRQDEVGWKQHSNGSQTGCTPRSGQTPRLQKEHVLQWFQSAEESEATWVLNRLGETVPHQLFNAVSEKFVRTREVQLATTQASNQERKIVRKTRRNSTTDPLSDPVVQFTSSQYYAEEGVDDIMKLDVMRIGNLDVFSEVFYETEDFSAVAGRSYVATSGKLSFQPGELVSHIDIPILDNDLWNTTTEFRCRLKQEGLKGAVLGNYLHHTRVRIIDNDTFPTNNFSHLTSASKVAECPKWPLMLGYFKLVVHIPRVWSGTVKYILVDAAHNAWYFLNLLISVYVLDFILNVSTPSSDLLVVHDKHESLLFFSFVAVAYVAVFHMLDYARVSLPIVGPVRNFIQSALLRKFLNYKQIVREKLSAGDVMMGIQRDSIDLVTLGYINMLKVFSALGRMVCMLGFQLLSPFIFGGSFDWHACFLLIAIPLLLVCFLHMREKTTNSAIQERNQFHSDFTSQISLTTTNYHLVVDYSMRNHCESMFLEKQKLYSAAAVKSNQILENNMYFCKWCRALVGATWLLFGGLRVIDGSLSLGLFITDLRLFHALGTAFLELYGLTASMMSTFPALQNVTTLMNFPTDVHHRCLLKKKQRADTQRKADRLSQELAHDEQHRLPCDMMPIIFDFKNSFKFESKAVELNFMNRVEIQQGQMVAVVGPRGSGKATILRLIAGSVLPPHENETPIFVPSHLRCANVADEPLFFGGTMYYNLIFGLDPTDKSASHDRVEKICTHLTRSSLVSDYLSLEKDVEQAWQDVFSGAQCKLLGMARALIHNVEVMCIHKPLAKSNTEDADHIIGALHEHIDKRGLELSSDPGVRRPRTVMVSAATDRAVEEADSILILDPLVGIKFMIPKTKQTLKSVTIGF